MHFPGRNLRTYAEPITPDRLVVGETYFGVQYHDQTMLAPEVEVLVSLGNNLNPGPEGVGHTFQDAGSFLAGVRVGADDEQHAEVYRVLREEKSDTEELTRRLGARERGSIPS